MVFNSCIFIKEGEEDYFDGIFYIENHSSDTIYFAVTITSDIVINNMVNYQKREILPYKSDSEWFVSDDLKNESFEQIDIWKKSTLEKYTKEYIKEHDIVDKRYIVDYYDLEKLKFQIVYDGTE